MTDVLTSVPVVFVSLHAATIPRGYWDQAVLEGLIAPTPIWSPAGKPDYHVYEHFPHVDGLGRALEDGHDGAVVVVPGRHHVGDVQAINALLSRLAWCVVIITGDEEARFPYNDLDHGRMRIWVQSPMPHNPPKREDVTFFGDGYRTGTDELLKRLGPPEPYEIEDFFFAGQVTHSRRNAMANALEYRPGIRGEVVATTAFGSGLEQEEYLRRLRCAAVAPCPSGPVNPGTFRLWEALEAGCVPLVDAHTSRTELHDYWAWFAKAAAPVFPVVHDWVGEAEGLVRHYAAQWPTWNLVYSAWWTMEKRRLAWRLAEDCWEASGRRPQRRGPDDAITVLMPSSPVSLHPSIELTEFTIASVRAHLPDAEIIVMCDGVRTEQMARRADYLEYVRRLQWWAKTQPNVWVWFTPEHWHQARMTRYMLDHVRTPLLMFVEHDTPLLEDRAIDFGAIVEMLEAGIAKTVRLHHEASILEPHKPLMVSMEPTIYAGARFLPTAQWSQRPHVSTVAYYRRLLGPEHFRDDDLTMIEDVVHGPILTDWHEHGSAGWASHRLWIYAPEGDMKRSDHIDGRGAEPKYPMWIRGEWR